MPRLAWRMSFLLRWRVGRVTSEQQATRRVYFGSNLSSIVLGRMKVLLLISLMDVQVVGTCVSPTGHSERFSRSACLWTIIRSYRSLSISANTIGRSWMNTNMFVRTVEVSFNSDRYRFSVNSCNIPMDQRWSVSVTPPWFVRSLVN